MTLVQPVQIVRYVKPVCVARVAPKKTPLERELEAINGISLKQLGQAGTEVRGRVSVVTPTTASRSRFHPQLVDQSWPDKELVVVETYHVVMVGLYDHQPLVRIFPRHCARGLAIGIHRHQVSNGGGPHHRCEEKSHRLVGFW